MWVDNVYSDFQSVDVGVPQGSILGPLFFLVFYNDLPYILDCELDAYADDSTLTYTAKSVDEISDKLSNSCDAVSQWMIENKLKLNTDKTQILLTGTSQRLHRIERNFTVQMNGTTLMENDQKMAPLLGIYIQSNLKWGKMLHELQLKLKKRLSGLQKLKNILPSHKMKLVADGMFNSVMTYCLPVFGGCDKADINALQVLQNQAAKLVTKCPPRTRRDFLLNSLKWLSVNQLISYHTLLTSHKVIKSRCPEYLSLIFDKRTRRNQIILPRTNLELARRSFTLRGPRQWNLLPQSLRNMENTGKFKNLLRQWIFDNIPQFVD